MASDLNRRVKRWPGWVLLAIVIVGFLTVGATRSSGPQTQDDRVDAISRRVACPICDGESVFESQNNASRSLRNQIREFVEGNDMNDTEIIAFIESRYGAQVLLVPKASGFDALIWVLPAVVLVCATAGLVVVFRRWKREAGESLDPSDADRALVDAALAADAVDASHVADVAGAAPVDPDGDAP
ncbi:MAG: cytochrome c-type biogenesis protein CcmH [Ilumatobacteraceae bacterium]